VPLFGFASAASRESLVWAANKQRQGDAYRALALSVSLFSGFVVFAGNANHQGWWRCLVVLRLSQVCKASCARRIPSDILSLT